MQILVERITVKIIIFVFNNILVLREGLLILSLSKIRLTIDSLKKITTNPCIEVPIFECAWLYCLRLLRLRKFVLWRFASGDYLDEIVCFCGTFCFFSELSEVIHVVIIIVILVCFGLEAAIELGLHLSTLLWLIF